MVGSGGIHVPEVLRDSGFAPVPIGQEEALSFRSGELRGAACRRGCVSAPTAIALPISQAMATRPARAEYRLIERNRPQPVIVPPAGQGLNVVAALIFKRKP